MLSPPGDWDWAGIAAAMLSIRMRERIPIQRLELMVELLLMAKTPFALLKRCITFKGSRLARDASAFILSMNAEAPAAGLVVVDLVNDALIGVDL